MQVCASNGIVTYPRRARPPHPPGPPPITGSGHEARRVQAVRRIPVARRIPVVRRLRTGDCHHRSPPVMTITDDRHHRWWPPPVMTAGAARTTARAAGSPQTSMFCLAAAPPASAPKRSFHAKTLLYPARVRARVYLTPLKAFIRPRDLLARGVQAEIETTRKDQIEASRPAAPA